MEILSYIKKNKIGLIIVNILFFLLVLSIIIRYSFPIFYPVSIFFVILIFILAQYFDLDCRCFVIFSFILISVCPFLLFFNLERLAEYFANYMYAFLVFGIAGYFLDKFRLKLKIKKRIKIYRIIFLVFFLVFISISGILYYKDYKVENEGSRNYTKIVEKYSIKWANLTKKAYLKLFDKNLYYNSLMTGNNRKKNIIIEIEKPPVGTKLSGVADIVGYAIEKNSNENTGIDEIEFFLDGMPWKGKNLGSFKQFYVKGNFNTVSLINDLYLNSIERLPSKEELNYWVTNLEWSIMKYSEVANIILNNKEFKDLNLSNDEFIKIIYRCLLKREFDQSGFNYWMDALNGGLDRASVINVFIDSEEFQSISNDYYSTILIRKEKLDIYRGKVGDEYGKQFYLSGFNFSFDSTKFKNGFHTIYVYARSPVFGWDYRTLIVNIEN